MNFVFAYADSNRFSLMYRLAHVKGRENTTNGQNTTEATLLGFGDHVYVRNTSTDNTDTKSAYLTAVFQHPVVGEERGARAGLGSPGRNTATTNQEGLCCR